MKEHKEFFGDVVRIAEEVESAVVVDIKEWLEPKVDLKVGRSPEEFFCKFVEVLLPLLVVTPVDVESILKEVGKSFNDLSLTISLMKFLKFGEKHASNQEIIDALEEHLAKTFPPILFLMNINGSVCHRTKQRIAFDKTEEGKLADIYQHVDFFKLKGISVYFRDGYMAFLKGIMEHPRIKFGFVSSMMRKNILPIIIETFKQDMGLFSEYMFALFD